jgi:hypothetical protein
VNDPFLGRLQSLLAPVVNVVRGQVLDRSLEDRLNLRFPADSSEFRAIAAACREGVDNGNLCQHETGGIKYGRALQASDELAGMSVDVVYMNEVVGPHHAHPQGEIDMIMPVAEAAKFDGRSAGWLVYQSGSAHRPTVTGGDSLILYLLPNGEIRFTRT